MFHQQKHQDTTDKGVSPLLTFIEPETLFTDKRQTDCTIECSKNAHQLVTLFFAGGFFRLCRQVMGNPHITTEIRTMGIAGRNPEFLPAILPPGTDDAESFLIDSHGNTLVFAIAGTLW